MHGGISRRGEAHWRGSSNICNAELQEHMYRSEVSPEREGSDYGSRAAKKTGEPIFCSFNSPPCGSNGDDLRPHAVALLCGGFVLVLENRNQVKFNLVDDENGFLAAECTYGRDGAKTIFSFEALTGAILSKLLQTASNENNAVVTECVVSVSSSSPTHL